MQEQEKQRLQRKIDQHSVMLGLALKDGDKADAQRHMEEIKRLRALAANENMHERPGENQ